MAIALDPNRQTRYILKEDRELAPEAQTVFIIRPIRTRDDANIRNKVAERLENGSTVFKTGDVEIDYIKAGLVDVENFRDSTGKLIHIDKKDNRVTDNWLDFLSKAQRAELSEAIHDYSTLSPEEKKA